MRKVNGRRTTKAQFWQGELRKEDVHTHRYTEKTVSLPLCRGKLKSGTGIGP